MTEEDGKLSRFSVPYAKIQQLGHWHVHGVYASNICIALKISMVTTGDCNSARGELFRLLRGVWQTALLCNLARPVIAVLFSGKDEPLEDYLHDLFNRWASDQNWHQGHFSLYVEPKWARKKAEYREQFVVDRILLDFLEPEPTELKTVQRRQLGDIIDKLDERLKADVSKPEEGADLDFLFTTIRNIWQSAPGEDYGEQTPGPFQDWLNEINQRCAVETFVRHSRDIPS